jgi:calcium-dependent protein kinase
MLRPAEKRLTAQQVLEHPWIKNNISKGSSASLTKVLTKRLSSFSCMRKMEHAILTYMATQASEKEIMALRKYFMSLDKNGDGVLSMEEIKTGLMKIASPELAQEIVLSLDTNESGFVDYNGKTNI